MDITSMSLNRNVLEQLRKHKIHPRESDNDVLARILKIIEGQTK